MTSPNRLRREALEKARKITSGQTWKPQDGHAVAAALIAEAEVREKLERALECYADADRWVGNCFGVAKLIAYKGTIAQKEILVTDACALVGPEIARQALGEVQNKAHDK